MLLATVNPAAAAAIGNIQKVGVGNSVVYHARAGYMRDRRTSFPALVMRQHEDGSLDLLVFMEREDFATEEHVHFQSHNQPHHCWSAVEDVPGTPPMVAWDDIEDDTDDPAPGHIVTAPSVREMEKLHEHIAALTTRIAALEAKRKPGRPAKPKAT